MDTRSIVSEDDDRRSVASTTATTASLASRIHSLAVDFGPKTQEGIVEGFPEEEHEELEEVIEISEGDLLRELDRQEPAFKVCSRLFKDTGANRRLRKLTQEQADHFQQKGYVVVDNFLTGELAAHIRAETLAIYRQGRLREASRFQQLISESSAEAAARGDHIMWLHPGTSAIISPAFSNLLTAFQDLREDMSQIIRLQRESFEHQLSFYPPNGSQYVRHRDAFPDNGSEKDQRRVTAIVYANPRWRREDGGKLRLWPPKTAFSSGPIAVPNGHISGSHHPSSPNAMAAANGCMRSQCLHEASNGLPMSSISCEMSGPQLKVCSDRDLVPGSAAVSEDCRSLPDLGGESGGFLESSALPSHSCNMQGALGSSMANCVLPAARSPRSMSSSVQAEPTEASSIPDNASLDGGSVKSSGPRELLGNGRAVVTEEVGAAAVVDVAPTAGRLVLFLSGAVEHAVLPNFADRVAVTCWLQ